MRKLFNWRKSAAVVHTGNFMHYTPLENTYVYFRYDDQDSVMVVMNRGTTGVVLDTGRFVERLDGFSHGSDLLSGARFDLASTLTIPARSVLLLELGP